MKRWDFDRRECEPNQTPITIPCPHERQREFIAHPAKRKVIRAGRRGVRRIGLRVRGRIAVRGGRLGKSRQIGMTAF